MSDTPEIPDTLPHTPIDPNQPAEPNLITWDCGAIYTSYDGSWGKTPRMIAYWNDIADDGSTRFLICNKSQELDSIQKELALKNLGIQPATTTTFGLVRYTDNWQDTGSGDPGYWPVTLTRKAIIELCEHTIGEYSHTIDVEIYGKCADVYKQAEQAADLAVAASEAAEGFAGELRMKLDSKYDKTGGEISGDVDVGHKELLPAQSVCTIPVADYLYNGATISYENKSYEFPFNGMARGNSYAYVDIKDIFSSRSESDDQFVLILGQYKDGLILNFNRVLGFSDISTFNTLDDIKNVVNKFFINNCEAYIFEDWDANYKATFELSEEDSEYIGNDTDITSVYAFWIEAAALKFSVFRTSEFTRAYDRSTFDAFKTTVLNDLADFIDNTDIDVTESAITFTSKTTGTELNGKQVICTGFLASSLFSGGQEHLEGTLYYLRLNGEDVLTSASLQLTDIQTALATHTGNTTIHMTDLEHDLVAGISAGRLWYPTATGAIITYGEQADGIAVVSQDLYTTVEVTNSGIILLSINEPRWFNVRDMLYYNVLTAKTGATQDLISALLKRIEALENNRGTMHELYTGNGSANANVKYMVLDQRYVLPYRLSSIQIMARGSGSGQERLYAVIYQLQIGGSSDPTTWERKDLSLSSVQLVDGRYNIWNFNNVTLAGDRPIAIVMTPVLDGGFDTPGHMGIWCFERDADDTVSKCIGVGSINYVPQLVMTSVEYNSEAVTSISLADDDN